MRAVRYHEKGTPDVLVVEEVPTPEPGEGELLVKVLAAAVNYADVLRRSGAYYPVPVVLPHVPGVQMVGEVVGVGPGVDSTLIGHRVFGVATTGAHAEMCLTSAANARLVPAEIEATTAMAILSEAETASLAVKLAGRLQPGESVFIPAATGGVGFLAVQLARMYGAGRVFGGASSDAKRKVVAELGAIPIDYTADGWPQALIAANGGVGVDLALEVGGGQSVYDTLEAIRSGGRMVNFGNVSDTDAPVNPRLLLRRNLTLTGAFVGNAQRDGLWVEERAELLKQVDDAMRSGQLMPLIDRTYTLDQVADANRALENRATVGKVVLLPNG